MAEDNGMRWWRENRGSRMAEVDRKLFGDGLLGEARRELHLRTTQRDAWQRRAEKAEGEVSVLSRSLASRVVRIEYERCIYCGSTTECRHRQMR